MEGDGQQISQTIDFHDAFFADDTNETASSALELNDKVKKSSSRKFGSDSSPYNDLNEKCVSVERNGNNNLHDAPHQIDSEGDETLDNHISSNYHRKFVNYNSYYQEPHEVSPKVEMDATDCFQNNEVDHGQVSRSVHEIVHGIGHQPDYGDSEPEMDYSTNAEGDHLRVNANEFSQDFVTSDAFKTYTGTLSGDCLDDNNSSDKDQSETHTKAQSSKNYDCSFCNKAFSDKRTLEIHTRTHTGEKPYKCSVCDRAFSESGHIVTHMRIHTGEKPYECSVCYRAFSRGDHLKTHMRTHTGEKPHKCNLCPKVFSQKSNLVRHMTSHISPELRIPAAEKERTHKCTICEKAFSEAGYLKAHMRIHSGEKRHKCLECGKEFYKSFNLTMHMRIHTGEKPHVCLVCDKAFSASNSFKRHMRIVHGQDNGQEEKSYKCSVCDKVFNEICNIKTHMRTHTGEKPFQCSVCEKAFSESGTLKAHMRIHTGEKPHQCLVCGKEFNRSTNLTAHMRIHTGEKPHVCYVCFKAFAASKSLKRHLKTHTDESMQGKPSELKTNTQETRAQEKLSK